MNFDLSDLRAFVASADFGSFRAAADSLNISPSALSRRVEKLESALGVRLFERTTRKMELTVAGRSFVEKARNVLAELESSLFGMEDLGRRLTGLVTIACVPSAVSFFLPNALKAYHQTYPGIRVRLIDETSSVVFLAVARGEADFGLTYIGTQEPDIEFTPILQDPFVLACQRDHPLAGKRSVSWAEIAQYPDYMLLAQGSGNRTLIDSALANAVRQPSWFCEVQHVPALVSMIEAGLGIGIVPKLALPRDRHRSLVSIPVTGPSVVRTLGVIRRKNRPLPVAAQHFFDLLVRARGGTRQRAKSRATA
ncbi:MULTISPECIES: LysR family transcriptional regulator [Paraburkholderia]|jgi:DNA-binding transcriptional LysR family regulator|uniref:Transcriptional regulator, LysR family n=1 Tax=Paraburkholderia phenazinium TaxID=60549 RepID=A0A1N6JXU2_9BURK|nr:LysR family transcriptional regulator [Paraburkholderia phenazinium]SIO48947.1 transcriptional regulator, LysR family [Paraburkholderia phenazinium]